ncbi:MAG: hypothetical protein ACOH2T_19130 [Pseudomonas sp.]
MRTDFIYTNEDSITLFIDLTLGELFRDENYTGLFIKRPNNQAVVIDPICHMIPAGEETPWTESARVYRVTKIKVTTE